MGNHNNTNSGMQAVGIDTTLSRPKVRKPKELSKEAGVYWDRIVKSVPNNQFTVSDFALLSTYCENYAILIKARKMLEIEGEVLEDERGKPFKNPWFVIMQEVSGKIATIATKVMLSPSSRIKPNQLREKPTPSEATTALGRMVG